MSARRRSAHERVERPWSPRVLRVGSSITLPVSRSSVVYCWAVVLVLLAAATATLSAGSLGIPLAELAAALVSTPSGKTGFVLERLRGPRLATAVGVGALLGLSGTLFQTVTRNPLGSPDVLGLGAGAGAGVAVSVLVTGGTVPAPVGALVGAGAAIALVHVATGRGFASPARVIIAGIGVSAMAYAVIQYVVTTQLRDQATALAGYLAGSLASSDADDVLVAAISLAVVLPIGGLLARDLAQLELGDDLADALGTRSPRVRSAAILLAVAAAAAAVAVSGPIAFVALTAPQIVRRIVRRPGANLLASALTGALVLVLADLVTQQVPWAEGLPAGIVTAGVGGVYLGALLAREWRSGRL